MAKPRKKRSAIVPRIVKSTIVVGVIPACALGSGCSAKPPPPVVAAFFNGPPPVVAAFPYDGPPPVVAAFAPQPPPVDEETLDASVPDAEAPDAGCDAGHRQ